MSKTGYRVIVEQIEDGAVVQRNEVTEFCNNDYDDSHALGIAASGAIAGMCVYDEPILDVVVFWLIWRCSLDSVALKALGEVAGTFEQRLDIDGSLDDLCRVCVLSSFIPDPIYATPVKEFPVHVQEVAHEPPIGLARILDGEQPT